MKQNKTLRRALCVLAVLSLMVGSAIAASNVTKKMIEANYMGIKLVVDGVEVTPKDSQGNVIDPFISEGTTYLPVRAVGEALDKEVTWDGETKTVYIGQVPGTEDNWMIKLPPYQVRQATIYDGSDRKATFSVAGVTQTQGVVFKGSLSTDPFGVWYTNCQYDTMSFTIGHVGDKTHNAVMTVYLDGEYSTEYSLTYDGAPKTINIPLNSAPNVKLDFAFNHGGWSDAGNLGSYAIYNISFS